MGRQDGGTGRRAAVGAAAVLACRVRCPALVLPGVVDLSRGVVNESFVDEDFDEVAAWQERCDA